jgi:hypothetical protein
MEEKKAGRDVMRTGGLGIYRILLGTIPVIDLPTSGGRLVLGERDSLLSDLKLAGRSIEIVEFGSRKDPPTPANAPLRNHSLSPVKMRLAPENGKGMLLGRETGALSLGEVSGGPRQENAGGLY